MPDSTSPAAPLPSAITDIRVYVEGADGLHGRPYMPDHAIDVLLEIAWERQRRNDLVRSRALDDLMPIGDFILDLFAAVRSAMDCAPAAGEVRSRLLQVAGLAMAAVESIDRRTGNARPDDPIEPVPPGAAAQEAAAHG
ncbi:hypothetical protein FFK22_008955 [Mycobacterium sp. KBS0706]|uniref:hypothetical protein n=1 Tax=Mycobacterium sp. KBS0706 TaxID=2578109 RepID=UPI00110FBD19|nr:hypothetical protein [Mycobacterium sp. KBS0706]TSD89098.1 hypothetical protein FFK22_008955 [Mycobacterium sp. KBS0706]